MVATGSKRGLDSAYRGRRQSPVRNLSREDRPFRTRVLKSINIVAGAWTLRPRGRICPSVRDVGSEGACACPHRDGDDRQGVADTRRPVASSTFSRFVFPRLPEHGAKAPHRPGSNSGFDGPVPAGGGDFLPPTAQRIFRPPWSIPMRARERFPRIVTPRFIPCPIKSLTHAGGHDLFVTADLGGFAASRVMTQKAGKPCAKVRRHNLRAIRSGG